MASWNDAPIGAASFSSSGPCPGGYGWIFPKDDHVNVGVCGWSTEGPGLRGRLRRLLAEHGIPESAVRDLRGHRVPLRATDAAVSSGRVLLVGDAAGLADPLTGDGLYEAFLSAGEAAAAVGSRLDGRAGSFAAYDAALLARTGALCAASWDWKLAYDRFPRTSFAVTRLPFAWPVVQALLRGDLVDPSRSRGLGAAPLALLGLLGRAAKAPGAAYRREAARAVGAHARIGASSEPRPVAPLPFRP